MKEIDTVPEAVAVIEPLGVRDCVPVCELVIVGETAAVTDDVDEAVTEADGVIVDDMVCVRDCVAVMEPLGVRVIVLVAVSDGVSVLVPLDVRVSVGLGVCESVVLTLLVDVGLTVIVTVDVCVDVIEELCVCVRDVLCAGIGKRGVEQGQYGERMHSRYGQSSAVSVRATHYSLRGSRRLRRRETD